MDMKNIAVCGVGNIGRVHVSNLLSLRACRVAGIFDTHPQRLEQVSRELSVRPYSSWQNLLDDHQGTPGTAKTRRARRKTSNNQLPLAPTFASGAGHPERLRA